MSHRNDDGTFRGKQPKRTTNRFLLARWVESEVVRLKNFGMDFARVAEQVTLVGRGAAKPISELPADLRFPINYRISAQGCHKAYGKALRRESALAVEEHRQMDTARCEEIFLLSSLGCGEEIIRASKPQSRCSRTRASSWVWRLLSAWS